MMIVMAPEARPEHVDEVVARLEATGTVHAKVVPGAEQVAIAAIGDAGAVRGMGLETLNGVARVVPISRPYKLASSELRTTSRPSSPSPAAASDPTRSA